MAEPDRPPPSTTLRDSFLLLAVGLAALLPGLWQNHEWASGESLHAEIGREMAVRGDWIVPTRLGGPWVDEPPTVHVPIAALIRWTGSRSMFVARLPSLAAGLAGVLATFSIGLLLFDRRVAWMGALVLLTFPAYANTARAVRPDLAVGALVFLSSASVGWGMARRNPAARLALFVAGGITAGMATLAKGPTALAFPLAVVALVPVGRPGFVRPRWFEVPVLVVALAAGIATWTVPAWTRDGGVYVREVLGPAAPRVGTEGRPLHEQVERLLLGHLPLSIFLPLAIGRWSRHGFSAALAICGAGLLLALALPGKPFLLAASPFLALAIAEAVLAPDLPFPWLATFARRLVPLTIFGSIVYFTAVLAFVRPEGDPDFVFAAKSMERVGPETAVVCVSRRGEDFAWVAGRVEGIYEVYNCDDAARLVTELGPGTCFVATVQDRDAIAERLGGRRLEILLEYEAGDRSWFLCRPHPMAE